MALDGLFLSKIIDELQVLVNGRISKIQQISDFEILLSVRSNKSNYELIISIDQEYYRIHLSNIKYDTPKTPTGFTMFLRKHIEGGIITSIKQYYTDRVLMIEVMTSNELHDRVLKTITVELMGKYTNLVISSDGIVLEAMKHLNMFDSTRTIMPNSKISYAPVLGYDTAHLSEEEIKEIFSTTLIESTKDLQKVFQGLSKDVAQFILDSSNPVNTLIELVKGKTNPVLITKNKEDYYFNPLSYQETQYKTYPSLSLLLDAFFFDRDRKKRIKQKSNDLVTFIHKQLSKNEHKLEKLNGDLESAKNNEEYRIKGELLISQPKIHERGLKVITLFDYYHNEDIDIELDPKLTLKENSEKYFQKYHKAKSAVIHLLEQIELTKDEIEYFSLLSYEVEKANLDDTIEIIKELTEQKYMRGKETKTKKPKTKLLGYEIDMERTVLVGKNNVQNDIITNKLGKSNELWFHVKDAPGSHVLLRTQSEIREEDIRTCAMLAAFYSKDSMSSSIPVNYTYIRNIKKIPGKRNCFVQIKNEKTIYIDIDKEYLNSLKQITIEVK